MAKSKTFNNIETIIKEIKPLCKEVIKIDKLNGITMVCYTANNTECDNGISEVNQILTDLKLQPIIVDKDKDRINAFTVQYPELKVKYTDKQIEKMYKDNFKWLIDNLVEKDIDKRVDKTLLLNCKDVYVRQAILTFIRSNINPYKTKLEDLLTDNEYRLNVERMYKQFLEEYIITRS